MRGGAANRVLYGDPAFAPFAKVEALASPAGDLGAGGGREPRGHRGGDDPFSYGEYTGSDCVDQFCRFGSRLLATVDLPAADFPYGVAAVGLAGDRGTGAAAARGRGPLGGRGRRGADAAPPRGLLQASPPGSPGALGTAKGQTLTLPGRPGEGRDAERRWAGVVTKVRAEGGQADAALAQAWGYEWKDRKFGDVLRFVDGFLEKHGDGQKVAFEFDEDAQPRGGEEGHPEARRRAAPGRARLRLCQELGLAMSVDSARNVVRFSVAK